MNDPPLFSVSVPFDGWLTGLIVGVPPLMSYANSDPDTAWSWIVLTAPPLTIGGMLDRSLRSSRP